MKIITAAIIKGGTGKTTTAAALAQAAAAARKKVLAIDLDPQGNLTTFIGSNPTVPGSYELLHGTEAAQLIQGTEQGIDMLVSSPDLAGERTAPGSARRLLTALEPIKKRYDLIIIDTAPTMGELVFNALQASTGVIIPLEADTSSLQGLQQIADIAQQIQTRNPELKITGAVLTRYDARPKLNRYLRELIERRCKEMGIPFLAAIRPGIAIREAQATQRSLYDYAPNSKPALDYKSLFETIWRAK